MSPLALLAHCRANLHVFILKLQVTPRSAYRASNVYVFFLVFLCVCLGVSAAIMCVRARARAHAMFRLQRGPVRVIACALRFRS